MIIPYDDNAIRRHIRNNFTPSYTEEFIDKVCEGVEMINSGEVDIKDASSVYPSESWLQVLEELKLIE